MKLILQVILFFLLFCFYVKENTLSAGLGGLGKETWGAGGVQHDIEVNEIEDVEEVEEEDKKFKSNKPIDSIELRDIESGTIGTLYEGEGGLNSTMWQGSEREFIEKYLKLIPINKKSDLIIELTKQLLLTSAQTPPGESKDNIILIRINKLIDLGDLENAKLLIDAIQNDRKSEKLLKKEIEINLSLNNFDLVCLDIDEKNKKYSSDLFWQKIQIFCQILNGDINKANLGISLIKEDESFSDHDFLNIVDSLIYKENIDSLEFQDLSLLNLIMTRIGKINLDDEFYFPDDPLFLSLIYRMPNVPITARIQALEKSQKLISLPIETIEEIYNSYEVNDSEMNFSLDDKSLDLGPASQAILYQRAIKEPEDENKAKILKKALELGKDKDNYSLILKLNLKTLLEIKPSKNLIWFANTASEALFYSNETERAFEWYELLLKMKDRDIDLFIDFMDLWTIAEITKLYEKDFTNNKNFDVSQDEIISLINRFSSENKQIIFDTVGLYILETFGFKINPKLWLATINQQSEELIMPNPSIMSLLDFAIKNNRIGESVLLILIATDGKELNEFNPFFLQKIIQSLDRIGLGAKIKDLTIETLVF